MEVDWSLARPCKFCRAKIAFVKGPNGKSMPVQKVTMVFVEPHEPARGMEEQLATVELVVEPWGKARGGPFYVSHFQTCPDAAKASKKEKKS